MAAKHGEKEADSQKSRSVEPRVLPKKLTLAGPQAFEQGLTRSRGFQLLLQNGAKSLATLGFSALDAPVPVPPAHIPNSLTYSHAAVRKAIDLPKTFTFGYRDRNARSRKASPKAAKKGNQVRHVGRCS